MKHVGYGGFKSSKEAKFLFYDTNTKNYHVKIGSTENYYYEKAFFNIIISIKEAKLTDDYQEKLIEKSFLQLEKQFNKATFFLADALMGNYLNDIFQLKQNQVGKQKYNQWVKQIDTLYGLSIKIYSQITINREFEKLKQQFNNLICQIYNSIGEVEGQRLSVSPHQIFFISAYALKPADPREKELYKTKSKKVLFRIRFERYLGRQILIQRNIKHKNILAEEQEDLRLLHREQIRRKVKSKDALAVESIQVKAPFKHAINIEFKSFVVLCYAFKCNKNHTINPITAVFDVLSSGGVISQAEVTAGFCKECNMFFLLENDFQELQKHGVILCRIISKKSYEAMANPEEYDWKPESVLHQCGYNVNASNDLSTIQRQEILKRVIDHNLYSVSGLLSFLDWLIKKSENNLSKNMHYAIEKWKKDRAFVASYKKNLAPKVKVQEIIR